MIGAAFDGPLNAAPIMTHSKTLSNDVLSRSLVPLS